MEAAHEAGLLAIHERHERIAEVPVSSDRKWMAVQVRELAPGAASPGALCSSDRPMAGRCS